MNIANGIRLIRQNLKKAEVIFWLCKLGKKNNNFFSSNIRKKFYYKI